MNKIMLKGRVTKDVTLRVTPGGTPVTSFLLAVDRHKGKNNQNEKNNADFITCVAWKNTAQFCVKHLKQGTLIAVEGKVQTGRRALKDIKAIDINTGEELKEFTIPVLEVYISNIEILKQPFAAKPDAKTQPAKEEECKEEAFEVEKEVVEA